MLVAAGQFAVTSVWEKNAEICASLMAQAAENDVSLFVLRQPALPPPPVRVVKFANGDYSALHLSLIQIK
ncbi:hypothetical protein AWE58_14795 [Escherichia coli]|nr:hypothetical protein AWE58_14795 [Escherichia coli]